MKRLQGAGPVGAGRAHLCFYLWAHELKDPCELRASGAYSVVENKANRSRQGGRGRGRKREEIKGGKRKWSEARRHCLNAWFTLYVNLTF